MGLHLGSHVRAHPRAHNPVVVLPELVHDRDDLLDRFALAEDDLRHSVAQVAVQVEPGKVPQIVIRQRAELLEGVVDLDRSVLDAL